MAETVMTTGKVEDRPPKKTVKRKRPCLALTKEEKESQIKSLNEEMRGLFGYYKEMITSQRLNLDLTQCSGSSLNWMVAVLMEESDLPLSRLVEEIHMKLKDIDKEGLTVAAVKSAVVLLGQRVMYGIPNVNADVLEDNTEACLWCWETRDLKLFPTSVRGALKIRRTCRKKIHDRITAVSAMLNALQKLESDSNSMHDLMKASEKLSKVLNEADIRALVDSMLKKNGPDTAEKDVKREEKIVIKQLEKNKREVEKEKKRMDRELQKEKLENEKELKRLQEEAEKDERRREKEEAEMKKQLRKQQEEAEKDQRRREKEEAELKKQLVIQKQASIMERFLKRSKVTPPRSTDHSSPRATTSDSSKIEKVPEAVTLSMDCALKSNDEININDLRKSHLSSWRCFGQSIRSNNNQNWGIRRKPKTKLFKELKLTNSSGLTRDDELSMEKHVDGEETFDDRSCVTGVDSSPDVKKCHKRRQLLQFDKSHRPAFYGIWPKKSLVVVPHHPLRKDPDLDYEVDSDEEWEEEDPGESLSDCDKDDDEERLEEGCSKADDEEESEDDFFVPDGYLSEDEGVQVDRMETDLPTVDDKSSTSCKQELVSEESCALLRQQKYLHNLTEHALRKNQPLIILNLMHEKGQLLIAGDLSGTPKMEQTCLLALSMRIFPGGLPVEISVDSVEVEDQEACLSNSKGSTTPVSPMATMPESDLPTMVSVIQSCPLGINKVVEAMQQKLPTYPKSQLRQKVREISDFRDNRWQVKKEILSKLGMSISPERSAGRTKSIASFFSRRCLPPDGKSRVNPNETSPMSPLKPGSSVQGKAEEHL